MIEAPDAATATALWWASQATKASFDQLPEPIRRMVDLIREHHTARLTQDGELILYIDYVPKGDLLELTKRAGFYGACFPKKAASFARVDHVVARVGYGGPLTLIWAAPDYQRPVCGKRRWINNEPTDQICQKLRFHEDPCGNWVDDLEPCTECGASYKEHFHSSTGMDFDHDHSSYDRYPS